MSQHQPLSRNMPPAYRPPGRPSSRSRKLRNGLVVFFILAVIASMIVSRNEDVQRKLPFTEQDAPPVTGLHPVVQAKQEELKAEADKLGITVVITDGFRSNEEQDRLYEQGRAADGSVVTYARGGESYHNYGLAIDFALRTKDGDVIWDLKYDGNGNGEADWLEVVAIAKRLGFTWGGDWEGFKDYPHLQMDFGYSIGELQRGFRPPDDPE